MISSDLLHHLCQFTVWSYYTFFSLKISDKYLPVIYFTWQKSDFRASIAFSCVSMLGLVEEQWGTVLHRLRDGVSCAFCVYSQKTCSHLYHSFILPASSVLSLFRPLHLLFLLPEMSILYTFSGSFSPSWDLSFSITGSDKTFITITSSRSSLF